MVEIYCGLGNIQQNSIGRSRYRYGYDRALSTKVASHIGGRYINLIDLQ